MITAFTELEAKVFLQGRFDCQVEEPDGTVLRRFSTHNANPLGALDDILSVYLGAGTQKTTWFFGLINNAGFSTLSTADTMSSHAGWTEITGYSESVRQAWTPGAVSGQSITNPTSAAFTANASIAVYGAFIVSNSTKSGTTGILWATGAFPSVQNLTSGQVLRTTYSSNAAAA